MRCISAIFLCLFVAHLFAQNNNIPTPLSFRYFDKMPENIRLNTVPQEQINLLDKSVTSGKVNSFPVVARSLATELELKDGEIRMLGDKIVYFSRVKATGAQALIAYFDDFYLSEGSELYIYSPDRSQHILMTHKNNNNSPYNAADFIKGEELVFEYIPAENATRDRLHINEIGYAFNMLRSSPKSSREFNDAGDCEVNVNCEEGQDWQFEKKSVVRILVKTGSVTGWCSGTLLNNTTNDCTPYILSADHCQIESGTYATDANFAQWKFYFNYEAPTCSNPVSEGALASQVLTGSTRIAYSNDNGGDTGSDFLLMKLSKRPDTIYDVYYAGWSKENTAPQYGVGIHHPSADLTKISTYNEPGVSVSYGGTGSHWRVYWITTQNGTGVTEGGSSGSGLFNEYGLVVGTLTGGTSSCWNLTGEDYYGKVAYHWQTNGGTANRQLKPWLNPTNSAATYISGRGTCVTEQPSGVRDLSDKVKVSILPNPGSGIFTVQCIIPVEQIEIYDINGRLLKLITNNTAINITDFAKGVYIAQILTRQGAVRQKLVLK